MLNRYDLFANDNNLAYIYVLNSLIVAYNYVKKLYLFVLLGIPLVLMNACKKEDTSVDFHEDYFGLEEGRFVEYDVVEIHHDANLGVHETTYYRLKTVVGSEVTDNEGRLARQFYRYVYDTIYKEYKAKDVWTAIIDQARGELVEENRRKIKLVFAPSDLKEWNTNAFNDLAETSAYYSQIHKSFSTNGFDFDSTVTVEEDSTANLVEYRRKYEVYAKGIGMVKKHYQDLRIKNFDINEPDTGEEYFFTLVNYGKQ